MKTILISPDTRPELFNLTVNKIDSEGKIIGREYVPSIFDKDSFTDRDILKKKSAKGVAEIHNYQDKVEIWHELAGEKFKLAEQSIYLEYSLDGLKWTRSKTASTDHMTFSGFAHVDIDSETGKQTFTVGKTGYRVRCVWEVTRFPVYDNCFNDLRLDYSDYKGNVSDSSWVDNVRTIIFEPQGIKNTLVVDPYLGVETTATTITVDFDSGDTVTWTISDENASLIENTPIRVCVHEDYFCWYVYDSYMLRWQHDTAANTTGIAFASGNSYCTDANKVQIGSYDYYLYPATSDVNNNKTTYAAELADISITQDTGSAVTDRNWPGEIGAGTNGACYDGAFHVISDSSNAGKFTMDRARALFTTVIEEWPIMSGDPESPTEHLTFWDKMDSIADGHTPAYSAGGDTVAVNDTSLTLKEGTKGYGVEGLSGSFSFPSANNIDVDKGAITFDYYPNSGWGSESRFFFNAKLGDFSSRINGYNWQFDYGNLQTSFSVHDLNMVAGVKYSCHYFWYNAAGFSLVGLAINGKTLAIVYGTGESITLDSTMYILNYTSSNSSYDVNGVVDSFKIYDTTILPYGSFIPANIISGDVSYDMAHSDITLYSNVSSLDIGTTSVNDISNISNSAGTIAFQVDPSSSLSADETLFSAGTNFKIEWINADNDVKFTYGTATVQTSTSLPSGLDGKHWVVARYEANNTISIEIDGLIGSASASTAPTLGSAITWSSNVGMTKRTITSKQNTPQLWTANLTPLILPDFKSEVA